MSVSSEQQYVYVIQLVLKGSLASTNTLAFSKLEDAEIYKNHLEKGSTNPEVFFMIDKLPFN